MAVLGMLERKAALLISIYLSWLLGTTAMTILVIRAMPILRVQPDFNT